MVALVGLKGATAIPLPGPTILIRLCLGGTHSIPQPGNKDGEPSNLTGHAMPCDVARVMHSILMKAIRTTDFVCASCHKPCDEIDSGKLCRLRGA